VRPLLRCDYDGAENLPLFAGEVDEMLPRERRSRLRATRFTIKGASAPLRSTMSRKNAPDTFLTPFSPFFPE
jgi:hypothetical protein